jgi:hypothetical protein
MKDIVAAVLSGSLPLEKAICPVWRALKQAVERPAKLRHHET